MVFSFLIYSTFFQYDEELTFQDLWHLLARQVGLPETNAKVEQAIDGNFGGEMFAGRDGDGPPTKRLRPAYKNFSSAYMLVYIREDLLHTPDGAGTGG